MQLLYLCVVWALNERFLFTVYIWKLVTGKFLAKCNLTERSLWAFLMKINTAKNENKIKYEYLKINVLTCKDIVDIQIVIKI